MYIEYNENQDGKNFFFGLGGGMGVSFVTKCVAGFPFGFALCAGLSLFNEFKVGCGVS